MTYFVRNAYYSNSLFLKVLLLCVAFFPASLQISNANDIPTGKKLLRSTQSVPSGTSLASDNNPACAGATVNLTASVTPNTATGTVEFFDGVTSIGVVAVSGGDATLTTSALASGSHTISAVYSGDVNYDPSTSADLIQVIDAATPVTPGAISGTTLQCPGLIEQIYSITPVPNATSYTWAVPTGWTITGGAGTDIISVTTGGAGQNGNITVTASNACGTSGQSSLSVTVVGVPSTPGTITGPASGFCSGINQNYSVAAVPGATSYNWNLPAGWTIVSGAGTRAIVATPSASGNVTVTAENSCGSSGVQSIPVTVNQKPATPGVITGPATTCPGITGLNYTIAAVPGATSYAWTFPGGGWTITGGGTTTSVTVTSGTGSGNILVAAVNGCGSSATPTNAVINPTIAVGNTGYTDGATKSDDGIVTAANAAPPVRVGYLKFSLASIPAGVTVTASNLKITNNGTVGSSGGPNTVRGINLDPVTGTAVNIFAAANASTDIYSTAVWGGTGQLSLNLVALANTNITSSISAPGYIAMALVRGSGTTVYNFFGYSGGANAPILTITYANVRSFAVIVNPGTPATPGTITGNATPCPNSTGNGYSIAAVANATSYTWAVPAGWAITAGQGTINATITAGSTGQNGNVTVTATNSCGTSAPSSFAVTPQTAPTVAALPATQTRCSGVAIGTINISNPNGISGTTFSWTRSNTANLTGIAASGSGATITGTLTNNTAAQQTTVFTITASAGCPPVGNVQVSVIVNPRPVANAGPDQSVCAAAPNATIGGSPTASGGQAPYGYLWTAGVSNTTIANPTAPAGTYTVTVTDNRGCSASDAVTVTSGSGTKTWIGSGSTTGGGADANFNNPANWSPAGVPGACHAVVMNMDIVNIADIFGNLTVPLTADATIASLAIDVNGLSVFGSGAFFKLEVGTRNLNILGATTLTTRGSSFFASPAQSYISVGNGGVLTYGGNFSCTISNNCTNYPIYATTANQGTVYFKGASITFAGVGNDPSNKPSRVVFDRAGTQTVTNNNGTQPIYFSATSTDIGEVNSPTVSLVGTGTFGFRTVGNLTINNTATLDIGATQAMNRYVVGGSFNMSDGSFLKVRGSSGGTTGSNFPNQFTTFNFAPTSTVDYTATVGQTIYPTPLYGNLTASTAGTKTISNNTDVQNNITIANTAILAGGAYRTTLGGNWTSYGQVGFSEQTSVIDFVGTGAQTINTTGGEIFYILRKLGTGTTTMLSDVGVQGGGASGFSQSNGILDAGTNRFYSGASTFTMSGGVLKLGRLVSSPTYLPEFDITPYNISGGTIELNGAGDQVLRGARAYRNLTFSTSGLKTVSSAIPSITGTILTQNSVTLDVSNNTMGGAGTNLTMTGTSLYKTAGTGTKPDAQGIYALGVGTTVEFTNSVATTEDIRLTAPTYYNVVVSGANVANTSAGVGIRFQSGGTFTVKNAGLFKLANTAGFSGGATTSVANTNNPNIVLETGSTVEYYGGPAGTNAQTITNVIPYYHLNFSGTSVKTAPAATLTVLGNLSNTNSGFTHSSGTVLLSGIVAQNYNSTGTPLNYYNITATNPINVNVNGDLSVTNLLSLGTTGKLNFTTGSLTLRSTATGTAAVDKISNANSIGYSGAGRFVVERFIPTGSTHGKTWQFLAAPAFGSSVNASWQEGDAPIAVSSPGYGTTITSEKVGAVSRGYDFYTAAGGPSIKKYNPASNAWEGIDNGSTPTSSLLIDNPNGYMIFVRGDRSVQASSTPANATTLRTRGKLYAPGTDAPTSIPVGVAKLASVGNPYASALDFANLRSVSSGIDDKFYVWDPLLTGTEGYGAYQVLSSTTGWVPTPGGTANYPTGVANSKIQSGQAFFVYSTPGGTVNFSESNKLAGSQVVFRGADPSSRSFLRANLYRASGMLADGNVVAFDPAFRSGFNTDDAIKIANTVENFGITHPAALLSVDARPMVAGTDTIHYNLTGLRQQEYYFKFGPSNISRISANAFLIDRFLNSATPVSLTDSTTIHFTVTAEAASAAANRFYLVFRTTRPLPMATIRLSAVPAESKSLNLQWKTENGQDISSYEIQRSVNGREFETFETVQTELRSTSSGTAHSALTNLPASVVQYRVKGSIPGTSVYSNVVKWQPGGFMDGINIYPNPIEDKTINMYFGKMPSGTYSVLLTDAGGRIVYRGNVALTGESQLRSVNVGGQVLPGNYRLSINAPGGKQFTCKLLIN